MLIIFLHTVVRLHFCFCFLHMIDLAFADPYFLVSWYDICNWQVPGSIYAFPGDIHKLPIDIKFEGHVFSLFRPV